MRCNHVGIHYHVAPTAEDWRADVEQAFQASGMRSTAPRRAILNWIAGLSLPFTAETLVHDLETERGISSRATIYRMVDWLRAEGWIGRVRSDSGDNTYARRLPGHHHHVVCNGCGALSMIGGCNIDELLAPVLAGMEFDVRGHMLELYGLCKQCRLAEETS